MHVLAGEWQIMYKWRRAPCAHLVKALADREVNGDCHGQVNERLSSCTCTRRVSLSRIMDRERTIAQGHVVLGFSGCGHYLISYCCEVSMVPPDTFYRYSLHWWYFDLYRRLRLVASYDLFRDELISEELRLIVCQSLDQQYVIVLGCRGTQSEEDEIRTCSVTILPSPPYPPGTSPTPNHSLSVHFKFDILFPFPSFVPALCLRIPGILLLNTGDSLLALYYHISFADSACLAQSPFVSRASLSSAEPLSPLQESTTRHMEIVWSPSNILQVEVYKEDTPLSLTSGPAHQQTDDYRTVLVDQSRLDVEFWVNDLLRRELKKQDIDYRSLIDYDLQLYEVDGLKRVVKFLIVVLLEAYHSADSVISYYSVDMLAQWSVCESQAQLVRMFHLKPAHCLDTIKWKRTARIALHLRKCCYLPISREHTIRAFSNHNVYAGGKSLQALSHPHLPVQLVLVSTISRSQR